MHQFKLTFLAFFGSICTLLAQSEELTIAVAANLQPPMRQIEARYEKDFQSDITLIVASSGKLTAQIVNGAPYDIFISADMKYPEKIFDEGLAQQPPKVLINGKLYFWTKAQKVASIEEGLAQASSIAVAQPELAPYGYQTKQWMEKTGNWVKWQDKIVYGENVSQVNQYIATATVDAAFTSNSAMHTDPLKGKGSWLEVPDTEALPQGMVLLRNAEASEQAVNQFLEFIISPVAQQIFQNFGYEIP